MPFNFSFFSFFFIICAAVFVKATFPEPGCDLCYSSCAFCPTRSWKDRKTYLENYFVYVIGDYRTAAPACAWYWQPHAQVSHGAEAGAEAGLNNARPMGPTLCNHSSLKASFFFFCFHARNCCVSPPRSPVSPLPVEKLERKLHQAARGDQKPPQLSISAFQLEQTLTHMRRVCNRLLHINYQYQVFTSLVIIPRC